MTTPVRLTVDHQHAPLGVAVAHPALSWQVPGTAPATAYEVEVRRLHPVTGAPVEPPLWTTGRVEASPCPWLTYGGEPLASDTDHTWRVRVWTGDPATTAPSAWASSTFSTSLLTPAQATAPWVEPAQVPVELEPPASFETLFTAQDRPPAGERLHPVKLVRQDLDLSGAPITRARLFTSAQGVIEVRIDGEPVGDTVLAPGWTSYDRYTEFDVHDVTGLLRAGSTGGQDGAEGRPDTAGEQGDESGPGTAGEATGAADLHTLGLQLADGWFAGRMSITGESGHYGTLLRGWWQLSLTRADGTHEVIGADSPCAHPPRSTTAGPLRYSDIMVGEKRDDRLAAGVAGWDRPGFVEPDDVWEPTRIVPTADLEPGTRLEPFRGEPVRRLAELPAVEVLTTPAGESVVDFGQVIAGRVRLTTVGPAGTEIVLEHSEHLAADGTFFSNVQGPNKDQRDVWILAGTGTPEAPEVYEPTFTFHGFRYARVSGYPGELTTRAATAVVVGSDLESAGDFACSDARLTRLHSNVVWSQRSNFLSIPTDCPQRERVGWTGDIQVFAAAATNNAEVHTFLARWLRNLRADQLDDGRVPIVSPFAPRMAAMEGQPGIGGITAAAGWGDAVIRVPLALWERYGDTDTLAATYPAMQAWVEMQSRQAATELPPRLRGKEATDWEEPDPAARTQGWDALTPAQAGRQRLLWNSRMHFGDWLAPSTLASGAPDAIMTAPWLTSEFVGAAFHAEALRTLARVAEALGHVVEAAAYHERWEAVRGAVAEEYIGHDGAMSPDLQGMYVLALAFDLVEGAQRHAVADHLLRLVRAAGHHLDTGFLSIPFLLDVLEAAGYTEEAWALLLQTTMPSWLYEVEEGATTIWESWGAVAPDGTVGAMSFNHYAFGVVDDWLFRRLGGIDPVEPGYRRVRVAPLTGGPVSWARTHRDTPFGRVSVAWKRTDTSVGGSGAVVGGPGAVVGGSGAVVGGSGSAARPAVRYDITLPAGVTGELVTPDGHAHALPSGRTVLVG